MNIYNQTDLFKQLEPPQTISQMLNELEQIHADLNDIINELEAFA